VLLAAVLVVRIVWRLTRGRRLPAADQGLTHVLAKATHWALYALVAAMLLVGMALAWTRGDSLFNLFTIPAYDPGNKALASQMGDIHATIGWIILAVAGLHAAAALFHRFVWHDGVLARMLLGAPGRGGPRR
jgi:cytochrome b561